MMYFNHLMEAVVDMLPPEQTRRAGLNLEVLQAKCVSAHQAGDEVGLDQSRRTQSGGCDSAPALDMHVAWWGIKT